MKKVDMIEYLDEHNIDTTGQPYGIIREKYWATKRANKELISQQPKVDVSANVIIEDIDSTQNSPLYGTPRHEQLKEIIPFMKTMVGRSKGTNEEVHKLIHLHNQFYNRRDSVGCSTCVGSVHKRMVALYKKYKQYYD